MAPRTAPAWTIVDFIHQGPWWTNRGIFLLNICLALPLLTAWVNGLDSSLINGLQTLPDWQDFFGHPTGAILGLIGSAQNIGAISGLPITPYFSDTIGRRATLFIGSLIMLGGVLLQFLAPTVKIFIGARILVGFGLGFCINASPLLLLELSYPTQRGKFTSLYNACWYVGSVMSAWICYATYDHLDGRDEWSWRVPTLIQALIPFLQVALIWFIPESPRFLVSKGKEGQAAKILAKYHANGGDERDPLVQFEMAQIRHAIRMEGEISQNTSYLTLFSTPGNRRRMKLIIAISIFSQWSGNGLVSYYINLVLEGIGMTSSREKTLINGILQVFNLVVGISGALLVDKIGRRPLFIISNTGMLAAFSCWTLTTALFSEHQNKVAAKATIPIIFIYYLFYDIAYTPMLVSYSLEILPYKIRARGFAVMNFTVFLTVAFNQFINPLALKGFDRAYYYYLVYVGWLALELLFVVTQIVETRGYSLEETAAMFDGEDAQNELMVMAGETATVTMLSINRGFEAALPSASEPDLDKSRVPDLEKGKRRIRGSVQTNQSSNESSVL
ncbi:general substrate transporter [Flagelloscypha sp. PMI_526]|nr:general substrate transporter [Flagelloscypha sp. PMI_526]